MLLCDEDGCGVVQHAACSLQKDSRARHWRCDDCWLMAGERPAEGSREIGASSGGQGNCPIRKSATKQRRTSTAGRLGWEVGARVLDACGAEYVIAAMQHRYVQCSRPDALDFATTAAESYNCF